MEKEKNYILWDFLTTSKKYNETTWITEKPEDDSLFYEFMNNYHGVFTSPTKTQATCNIL